MAEVALYDALSGDYDRFIHWPQRLARELPVLERLFAEHGVCRVLDAACGTGRHVLALRERGYLADGADLSAEMIARARAHAKNVVPQATFWVAGFGELATCVAGPYDALLCLGNSLPHLLEADAVQRALNDFAAVLRPGGLLIIQNRNYDLIWHTRERFMPLLQHRDDEGEWLFFRFMDFHETNLAFHVVTLARDEEGWAYRVASTKLRPMFQAELAAWLEAAGFGQVRWWGGYDGSPYDPERSGDLLALALKRDA